MAVLVGPAPAGGPVVMAAEDQADVGIDGQQVLFQVLPRAGEPAPVREEAVDQQDHPVVRIGLQHPLHPGEIVTVVLPADAQQQKILSRGGEGVVPADPVLIKQIPLLGGAEAAGKVGAVVRLIRPHVVVPRHGPEGELPLQKADGGLGVGPVARFVPVVHDVPREQDPQGVLLGIGVGHVGEDLVEHLGIPVGVDLGVADPVEGKGRGLRRVRRLRRRGGHSSGAGQDRRGGGWAGQLLAGLEPDLHLQRRLAAGGHGPLGAAAAKGRYRQGDEDGQEQQAQRT